MYGVDVAELAVKISEGALYPNLGLTASYTQSYDIQPQVLREANVSILGQLTVPIYQGGTEYSAIR
jgi:outer membrane protein